MRGSSMEVLLVVCGLSLVSVLVTYQWVAAPWAAPAHPQAPSAVFIPSHLHHILHSLESQQLGVESNKRVAKIQGSYHDWAELYASLLDVNYQVNTTTQDWSLLLCGPHLCTFGRLTDGQKVSQMPGLASLLASPEQVCRLQRRLAEAALGGPKCFSVPKDFDDLLNEADGAANRTEWLVDPQAPGKPPQALSTFQLFQRARLKKFPERGIIKTSAKQYLLINGQYTFTAHFTILITSMAPLRAYLDESHGPVQLKSKFNTTENQKTWDLRRLWATLRAKDAAQAKINVRQALLFLLLAAESALTKYLPSSNRQNFFQLISVQVTLDEDLLPLILGFNPDPRVGRKVLSKALRLVTATDWVHDEITHALLQSGAGCDAHKCPPSREDFLFLMSTRREALYGSALFRLYPQSAPLPSHWILHFTNETGKHATVEGDSLFSALEYFFANNKMNLIDNNVDNPLYKSNLESLHVIPGRYLEPPEDDLSSHECSEDDEGASFLRYLTTDVGILSPPFDPEVRLYQVEIPYNTTLVQIKAASARCGVQLFFDDQFQPSLSYKSSVGLGDNKLPIRLHRANSTLNTYWLTLSRHPERPILPFDASEPHQVCSFKQDCRFRFSPSESCGLHQETDLDSLNWPLAVGRFANLAACRSGDAAGRWILPCGDCEAPSSCWWNEAKWQPFDCNHPPVKFLHKCLEKKQILFIGDSTVRGMMNYLLEQLNGSLGVRDKSHSLSHFRVGQTQLYFAYYPQFWLRPPHRPVFAKTLYQLLLSAQPLRNSSETILVVGGVHWLATTHMHTLIKILKREGLEGAKVVIKTLGSGFHIPADGVHLLSTRQQEKLVLHSQGLAAFGKHFHMEVVDTFNITAARFRDFLPGKCACHFHTVNAGEASGVFHIEGAVNAIYSQILLARMCS